MRKRHCDVCDKVLDTQNADTMMVRTGELTVKPDIERWMGDKWMPTVDYCRECLGNLMFEYSQWLLRKL